MILSRQSHVILLVVLAVGTHAFGVDVYRGAGAGRYGLYYQGSFGSAYLYDDAYASVDATIGNGGTTVTYLDQTFSTRLLMPSFTDEFTVGIGNTVSITLNLTLDVITTSQSNWGPWSLQPATGGLLHVQQPEYPQSWTSTITGAYEILGPTETASGTFSKPVSYYPNNTTPANIHLTSTVAHAAA